MAEIRNTDNIRAAAVAGSFYPAEPAALRQQLDILMAPGKSGEKPPKAMILPHAGYIYSGPVAASGYARLGDNTAGITRVILIGPAHRKYVRGLVLPAASAFSTPLGTIPLDTVTLQQLEQLQQVSVDAEAHAGEHCLEVQLPFLQKILHDFSLVPVLVGEATVEEVAEVIGLLWGASETLVIISSDLSHYQDYETATQLDQATSRVIESLAFEDITHHDACGSIPIAGLLLYARRHNLQMETIDLRNSADTAGPRDRVVGYGAYILTD
jgi:AmmeMemoRadiSam system protein B